MRLANASPTKAAAPPTRRAVPPRIPSPIKPSAEQSTRQINQGTAFKSIFLLTRIHTNIDAQLNINDTVEALLEQE